MKEPPDLASRCVLAVLPPTGHDLSAIYFEKAQSTALPLLPYSCRFPVARHDFICSSPSHSLPKATSGAVNGTDLPVEVRGSLQEPSSVQIGCVFLRSASAHLPIIFSVNDLFSDGYNESMLPYDLGSTRSLSSLPFLMLSGDTFLGRWIAPIDDLPDLSASNGGSNRSFSKGHATMFTADPTANGALRSGCFCDIQGVFFPLLPSSSVFFYSCSPILYFSPLLKIIIQKVFFKGYLFRENYMVGLFFSFLFRNSSIILFSQKNLCLLTGNYDSFNGSFMLVKFWVRSNFLMVTLSLLPSPTYGMWQRLLSLLSMKKRRNDLMGTHDVITRFIGNRLLFVSIDYDSLKDVKGFFVIYEKKKNLVC